MHTPLLPWPREEKSLLVAMLVATAACGTDASPQGSRDAGAVADAVSPPYCTAKPAGALTDLSGRWVLKATGSQLVTAPAMSTLQTLTVLYALADVTAAGAAVRIDGRYCDRSEVDSPTAPVKVSIPGAWAHTEVPFVRTGSYATSDGVAALSIDRLVEVFGATLADPADPLPTDPTDPRIVDVDGDLHPGLTVNLTGLFTASVYSVQRQTTGMLGIPVSGDRIEGTLSFLSEQNIVGSTNANVQALYAAASSSADFDTCHSTFTMVRVGPVLPAADGGPGEVDGGAAGSDGGAALGCAWVRANAATLFP